MIGRSDAEPAVGYRFEAFAAHYQDYEPSADHYANMVTQLQLMLLQPADDDKMSSILLPAWDCGWDVKFKLRGVGGLTVEGEVKDGKVQFSVEPSELTENVVVGNCGGGLV